MADYERRNHGYRGGGGGGGRKRRYRGTIDDQLETDLMRRPRKITFRDGAGADSFMI